MNPSANPFERVHLAHPADGLAVCAAGDDDQVSTDPRGVTCTACLDES